jgi:hypothetical protein
MRMHGTKSTLLFLNALLLGLTGCQTHFTDLSSHPAFTPLSVPDNGYYSSPVWMSEDLLIFTYRPPELPSYLEPATPDLRSYSIKVRTWRKVPLVAAPDCPYTIFTFPQRLPDEHLGFVNYCVTNDTRTLQEMNIKTGIVDMISEPVSPGVAGQFSFSPDMSALVQEDMTGRFLSNKLFYRRGDVLTQIVPTFVRAMYPAWSPQGDEIVFWGTASYPGGVPTEFKTYSQIAGLGGYPWDLYISAPDGTKLRIVLPAVSDPRLLKWSPIDRIIAFSGTFEGREGVWLLEPDTVHLTRVWPEAAEFDWSPDSSKMVIIDQAKNAKGEVTSQEINILSLK